MERVPYGYKADEEAYLEIVPEEAEVVREIISNVAEGSTLYGRPSAWMASKCPGRGTATGAGRECRGETGPPRPWVA